MDGSWKVLFAGLLVISCGAAGPSVATVAGVPRCVDARPATEISYAGALPYGVSSSEIVCVLHAVRHESAHSRVYRLKDGRHLNVYQYLGQLPQKPAAPLRASGATVVGGTRWHWSIPDHPQPLLVISVQVPDAYVDLSVPMHDRERDLELLRQLASSIRLR